MKKLLILAALSAVLLAVSCSDSKDSLELESGSIDVYLSTSGTVGIISGSGDYSVVVADEGVATAEIAPYYGTPYSYGVRVTAKKLGRTSATVTDKGTKQSFDLDIRVNEAGLTLRPSATQFNIEGENIPEDAIREEIGKSLVFDQEKVYTMSGEEKGIMYISDRTGLSGEMKFRHVFEGETIYLVLGEGEGMSRLRVVSDGMSPGLGFYLWFFGYNNSYVPTRADMIATPRVYMIEDLTDVFREDYPAIEVVEAAYRFSLEPSSLN